MDPLLAVAVSLVPDLVKLIAGDDAGTVSQQVAEAVKSATGADDDNGAQAKLEADPAVRAQLQKQLAEIALEATKEQNRANESKRSDELAALREQMADVAREREDVLVRFREEMKSSQDARTFYSQMASSGNPVAWVNPALSVLISGGFLALVYVLLFLPPSEQAANNQVFNIALGALATAFATVIGFHFGSSIGSKEKDSVNKALVAEQVFRRDAERPLDGGAGSATTTRPLPPPVPTAGPIVATRAAGGGGLFAVKAPQLMRLLISEFQLSTVQAAGVLGNVGHECAGFQIYQEIGTTPPAGGWGICQWTGPRRRQFEAWATQNGHDFSSDAANFGFLFHELRTTEKRALAHLKATNTLEAATRSFMEKFERPGAPHLESRVTWANRAMAAFDAS